MSGPFRRTLVPAGPYFAEALGPGLWHRRLYPGGRAGPNGETSLPTPGGQAWSEQILLGGAEDPPPRPLLPDIRLPANQYWPLHWHDSWTAVLVVEGQCLVGDWWMERDDLLLVAPGIEYGPLLAGPQGVRLFEIFSDLGGARGGYAPEYRDHPTLAGGEHHFAPRSPRNRANEGRQTRPLAGVEGIRRERLAAGREWRLGASGEAVVPRLACFALSPGQEWDAPGPVRDFQLWVLWEGLAAVAGRVLCADDLLLAEPGARLPRLRAGAEGVRWLVLSRSEAILLEGTP
ncbi:MAG: hypothetical protein KatS3mg124_2514 [Porticoccaceae bacterium]|nr:MAG: hypothetical protein KatS3mg124_2514 [Porticoccaceae bacterium]